MLAFRQLPHFDRLDLRHGQDDELGDPHSRLDDERLSCIGVQQRDADLAAITRVDEPRRVDDADPVARGETGARLDETGVSLGNRDR
jgi:hypothetical protein